MLTKKTNKALVKHLMDKKGIETITISKDKVVLTVAPSFTPEDGERLCREIGHTRFQPARRGDKNYLVLERF